MRIYLFDFFEGTLRSSFVSYSRFFENITENNQKFFDYLDLQIDKVEDFYGEKCKESVLRLAELFHEPAEHRMAYNVSPTHYGGSLVSMFLRLLESPSRKDSCLEDPSNPNPPVVSAHTLEWAHNRVAKRPRQGKITIEEVAKIELRYGVMVEAFRRDSDSEEGIETCSSRVSPVS